MSRSDIDDLADYLERQKQGHANCVISHMEAELRYKGDYPTTASDLRRLADLAKDQAIVFTRWSMALKELIAKNRDVS